VEPIYELSARALPTGGEVRANDLPPLLIGQSQLTILIHGFNNDTEQASRSYARFLRETELRRNSLLAGRICVFFWPGDHGWYRYQDEIPRAIEAANVLRGYLEEIAAGQRIEVSLVCHSLGNRVALEFVARCLKTANLDVQVPRACLMAAAGLECVTSWPDLAGIARVMGAKLKS
jgi:esterase/lipase superfamily enzyme